MNAPPHTGTLVRWTIVALLMLSIPLPASASPEGLGDVGGDHAHTLLVTSDEVFTALFIESDVDTVRRYIGDDAVIWMPGEERMGAASLVAYVDRVKATYPGARFDIISTSLFGATATVTWRITGESFRIHPTESAEAVRVEGTGQLEITYRYPWGDQANVVRVGHETAISPLSSQELAGAPRTSDV